MDFSPMLDELTKLGAVSPEQARASLDRLDTLERNKPSIGQVGRYAGLGAVTAPAMGMISNAIRKKPVLEGVTIGDKARGLAADAAKGAFGMGVMPLLRGHLDRRAEVGTLRQYVQENAPQEPKIAFQQSMYGDTGGFVDFHQVSSQPSFRKPKLNAPVEKGAHFTDDEIPKHAGALTPVGLTPKSRLSSAMRIGQPKITNPSGPSIAEIAKPKGFGKPLPGATLR